MSTINVDNINEYTSAGGVTIDSLAIKDGKITSANATGLTLVNKTTFTDASNVQTDNVFSSTYNNYKMIVNLSAASAQGQMRLRLAASGTVNSSSNYDQVMVYSSFSNAAHSSSTDGSNPHNYQMIGYQSSTVKGDYNIDITGPANSSSRTSFWSKYQFIDTDGGFVIGSTTVDTAYDGYYIYPSAGGTISGTILVYGYGE